MKRIILAASAASILFSTGVSFAQSQTDEMSKVREIMQQSHQYQQQQRQDQQQSQAEIKAGKSFMQSIANSTKDNARQQLVSQSSDDGMGAATSAVNPTIKSGANLNQVAQLEAQIKNLNQANAMFQQQTDQRIDVLNQEHTVLENKLSSVSQVLGMLNQEVTQLSQQIQTAQHQLGVTPANAQTTSAESTGSFAQTIEHTAPIQYILYAILALLAVIILMLIPRRAKPRMQTVTAESVSSAANDGTTDTKDEYDFMGSEEAIPAKLDLARAYLAMEDYQSAKKVLKQILEVGNEAQRKEAQDMINKIPK